MKKILCLIIALVMALSCAGCSFAIGTKQEDYDYKDLFTWGNDTGKSSMLGYKIDLQQYGNMMLYVDTTFGHKFELNGETNTFKIIDKDDKVTLNGAFVSLEQYQALSSIYTDLEIKNINGRELATYYADGVDRYQAFTYLADCGMDVGCVMEGDTSDCLNYVAFRGTALEGSSSDVKHYLGKAEITTTTALTTDSAVPVEDPVATTSPTVNTSDRQIGFSNGNGFNSHVDNIVLANVNEEAGVYTYYINDENGEPVYMLETMARVLTDKIEAAEAYAKAIKENSGEAPVIDVHEEGVYVTGLYNGMIALVFTADAENSNTYVMALYATETENCINVFNSIIDDFLAAGFTSYSTRTEYGEPVTTTTEESVSPEQPVQAAGGFPEFTIPVGYNVVYEGDYAKTYGNDEMMFSVKSEPDDELLRFLIGEVKTYYDVYNLTEFCTYNSAKYGEITVVEGESDGIYTYFATNADGSANLEFSLYVGDKMAVEDCNALLDNIIG